MTRYRDEAELATQSRKSIDSARFPDVKVTPRASFRRLIIQPDARGNRRKRFHFRNHTLLAAVATPMVMAG